MPDPSPRYHQLFQALLRNYGGFVERTRGLLTFPIGIDAFGHPCEFSISLSLLQTPASLLALDSDLSRLAVSGRRI